MQLEAIAMDPPLETAPHARIVQDLSERGWSVSERFLPPSLTDQLAAEARVLRVGGKLQRAGVSRGADFRIDTEVRKDRIMWLDPSHCSEIQYRYLGALEELRLAVNSQLFLGLFEFEGHLAHYPPGSYYRRHLDRFQGTEQRVLTTILYLNREWRERDGGQLRLYTDPTDESRCEEIQPLAGRLVVFLSARFPHEVMPARRDRLSITGWFKRRAAAFPME